MLALPGPLYTKDEIYINGIKIDLEGVTNIQNAEIEGTGGTFWDPSYILCKYLEEHPELVAGKQVLELGCGLGLASMSAKLAGASSVVATDLPNVIEVAARNMERNHLDIQTRVVDWNHPQFIKADLILMADVIWMKPLIGPLTNTIKTLLIEHTSALLVNKKRSSLDFQYFVDQLNGFAVELLETRSGHNIYAIRSDDSL